ncbi:TetR/AcrR family transcriptional regulator [Actinomadura sp. BRA 177]|nr:TetR/AcrR family transcriptional regulator [Actinomadura sp. BRA 177]
MFDTRGYLGTSLQDVVAGTPVSKGALYFHFPTKADLAVAILREQHTLWSDVVSQLRWQKRAILVLFELSFHVAELFRDDVIVRASARLAYEGAPVASSTPPLFDGWATVIEELLLEAVSQGDARPETQARPVAEFIVAAFAGCERISAAENHRTDLSLRVRTMWDHLLPGLVPDDFLAELGEFVHRVGCDHGVLN